MKNLQVDIDESDFIKFGFSATAIPFEELKDKIITNFAKEALEKCNKIAKENGFSDLTLEEISMEIQASRNAKDSS
jgi:hypothetical protein